MTGGPWVGEIRCPPPIPEPNLRPGRFPAISLPFAPYYTEKTVKHAICRGKVT